MSRLPDFSPCPSAALAAASLVAVGCFGSAALADTHKVKEFTVMICEDGNRFVFDQDDGAPEPGLGGLPAYGNEFITQGFILPEAALGGGVCSQFPLQYIKDHAIGTWTCRGWHTADAFTHVEGPIVATTQNFDFHYGAGDAPGMNMVVTDGLERFDFDADFNVVPVAIARPVIGGSGEFRRVRGESVQELLDFLGDPPGVTLRVKFLFNEPVTPPPL